MILGFSEGFHDAAIALVDHSGNIIHASHAERSSGIKNDKFVSEKQKQIVSNYVVDTVAFFENPLLKRIRQLYAGQFKTAFRKRNLSFNPDKYYHHHLSHAAAAFQTSPYDEAACVVVDSIGEWDTVSIWKASYNANGKVNYKKVYSRKYPFSIGLWYSALTKYVELEPLDEEYIFMGMAAFGSYNSEVSDQLTELLHKRNNHRGIPEYSITAEKYQDVSATAQSILESELFKLFLIARKHSNNFCYGGGVALNCVANGFLMKTFPNLWIMPNPGDGGGALGAAALAYGRKLNWISPYLGEDITGYVDPTEVVSYLKNHRMCGIANGKAEYGPRALGNRSFLADPRCPNIKDYMNHVKRREMFRPFAPAILAEYADQYFAGPVTKYMSTTARCIHPQEFPGIVHADNTSRVQVVHKDEPTALRPILEHWHAQTGCPMLLNTSLNIKGKPMVDTKTDALEFEKRYNIKVF